MNRRNCFGQTLLSVLLILTLALTSLPPCVGAQEPPGAAPEEAPLSIRLADSGAVLDARATYRVQVALRQPRDPERLRELGVTVLAQEEGSATVLATEAQLEDLARLRFQPRHADQVALLLTTARLAAQATVAERTILGLASVDADGDGLTDTEEAWWCTDPLNPNTDGDPEGYTDGQEVSALLDFTLPRSVRWGYGPPFGPPNAWPAWNQPGGCNDGDRDTIPDFAETYMVGSRVLAETSDGDKFDDGQELFGVTYCPGAPTNCGYGSFPALEYWNYVKGTMPNWVRPPGDNPFVAAFPVPEVYVVPGSWTVERVTTITTSEGQMTQSTASYETSVTRGQGTSIADTVTWNNWEEVSQAVETPLNASRQMGTQTLMAPAVVPLIFIAIAAAGGAATTWAAVSAISDVIQTGHTLTDKTGKNTIAELKNIGKYTSQLADGVDATNDRLLAVQTSMDEGFQGVQNSLNLGFEGIEGSLSSGFQAVSGSLDGIHYAIDRQGQLLARGLYDISYQLSRPRFTETRTNGHSWGGAQTTTHEEYEEHSVSEGEAFTSGQNWSTAWAVDSSHAADLTFDYTVRNTGTEYARELTGIVINLFVGDDISPTLTYPAWQQFPNGKLENVFPGDSHTFSSNPIPLSLEVMRRIDLGESLRVVVEDYSYGADELFYQDAVNGGVTVFVEDGVEDGDETVDSYVIPTWGVESVQDVLTRFFPAGYDADGNLNALWTPEIDGTSPPVWHEHYLSDIAWWNVYLTQADAGNTPLQDLPAQQGSAILFRFNRDADRDGYPDRAEFRYYCALPAGDPDRPHCSDAHLLPEVHPRPEVLAGYVADREGDVVTVKLVVENHGTFDAYGIDAVLYAPDGSVTIGNNTVGGNGRVRPGNHVAVGSLVLAPNLDAWGNSTSRPYAGGDYAGNADRTYTFSAGTSGVVGLGSTSVNWNDGAGGSGSLSLGSSYHAPLPLDVADGLQAGFNTGTVEPGASFSVQALTPRDTFTYTVESEPYTEPVIVVSYSDPQGSHRFITPVALPGLDSSLAPHSGEMLEGLELSILTQGPVDAGGPNTTTLVANNPHPAAIEGGHLYLNFVADGDLVAELPFTLDIPPGPTVFPVVWSTGAFSLPYDAEADNLLIAFWTDAQNNIIDSAARPLSSFQADPQPALEVVEADELWDFGTAQQGTLMQRAFALANTGYRDLLTHLSEVDGVTVSGGTGHGVAPADMALYTVTVNTQDLSVGPFEESITVRTSDADRPTRTITIRGEVTPLPPDSPGGAILRPLDWEAEIPGDHSQGEWVEFSHTLGPEPQSLHPVKVYSQDYGTLWGVGKYATPFGSGTASYDMFGDGRDGVMPSSGNLNYDNGVGVGVVNSGGQGSYDINVTDVHSVWRVSPGDVVLIHQTQGANAGCWELNKAVSDFGGGTASYQLAEPLRCNYASGGNNHAQIQRVPQYTDCPVSGTVTPLMPWNGSAGGLFAVMCNGTMDVSGSISVSGMGYRGGAGGPTYYDRQGRQGESYAGVGGQTTTNNAGGGGGGGGDPNPHPSGAEGAGGGGGGYATAGANGQKGHDNVPPGIGGTIYGSGFMSEVHLGSGGGGGGADSDPSCSPYAGAGGSGGGGILIYAKTLLSPGSIVASGGTGSGSGPCSGAGGGGSGGSILITVGSGQAAGGITAVAGNGGDAPYSAGFGDGDGGSGGMGRIAVQYCESFVGSTNPAASTQKLNCYMTEQVDSAPYDTARLNLPESFTGGRTYKVQYGRRLVFGGAGEQTPSIRLPRQIYASASLDALVSETGVPSGDLNLSLDIGDDGTPDWSHSETTTFPVTLVVSDVVDALNGYLVSRDDVAWGAGVDVPVRVVINREAQVLLTNLVLSLQFNQPTMLAAGALDTGADRPLDWTAVITGSHAQGEEYVFTHTLGPEAASIHPCKVYDQGGSILMGVGKYATAFEQGIASYDIFGDGRDGDLVVGSGQTVVINQVQANVTASGTSAVPSHSNGFEAGDLVLFHQTQGTANVGRWEFNTIAAISGPNNWALSRSLQYAYDSNNGRAQVIKVPQYRDLTVQGGGTLTAPAWDGSTGGLLVSRVGGTATVDGVINVSGKGFRGGAGSHRCACQAYSGESYNGVGSRCCSGGCSVGPNNGGGGNGGDYAGTTAGGCGAGHGANGSKAPQGKDMHGIAYGVADLSLIYLGSGGGGGYEDDASCTGTGGAGGNGGGIVALFAKTINVTGNIISSGSPGVSVPQSPGAGGGGGSAGSILIETSAASLGGSVTAVGGSGGAGSYSGAYGGAGGYGRIRIEYCESFSGSTNPPASTQKLNCYIAEQVETAPYDQARLYLPEVLTDGGTYIVQFGRRYVFPGAGEQTKHLGMNRQMYGAAGLDALVSNTGVSSGALNLCLDVGDDGTCDYSHNATTDFPATLEVTGLADALNEYLLGRTDIAWGEPVSVPVSVQIDRTADVMLTNLALTPVGAKTRFLRLAAGAYDDVSLSLEFSGAGVPSGPLAFTVDVGVDGSVDWSYADTVSFPAVVGSPDLAGAFNAYLSGRSGDVDVPLRIVPSPFLDTALHAFSAIPTARPDAALAAPDITFGLPNPTEGETVPVQITLHNVSGGGSGPLTAAAYAEAAGWGEWYVGSAFVPDIPAGGSAEVTIQWNTLGFTGTVPLRVVADPHDRLAETNEWNNEASKSLDIKTRPDLHVSGLSFAPADGREGQPLAMSATVANGGETGAASQSVAFYDGAPGGGGTLLGTGSAPVPAGGSAAVEVGWMAAGKGPHTIYAVADSGAQVSESREDNNTASAPLYVGLYDHVYLDSGGAPDPAYDSMAGYGWIWGTVTGSWGPSPEESYRWNQTGPVRYQFDYLVPSADYHLDLTLLDGDGGIHGTETLSIDGVDLGSADLSDGLVHWLSVRPDGVLYGDHSLVADITADGFGGSVASEVALREIQYVPIDCGPDPDADPAYSPQLGHGHVNGYGSSAWGTTPYETFRYVLTDTVLYRFDGLDAARDYQLNVTLYQEDAQNRQQTVLFDGVESGLTLVVPGSAPETRAVPVPAEAYSPDGSVVVGIRRTNGNVPIVNAIALEQRTVPWPGDTDWLGPVIGTPSYSDTVASDAPFLVTADIRDEATGGHGVAEATLYYGYASPYNQSQVAGTGPGGNGDGTWTFEIPAQGEGHEGETLWFWLTARDGDDSPTSSIQNNGGSYYAVSVEGVWFRIYLPLVMRES